MGARGAAALGCSILLHVLLLVALVGPPAMLVDPGTAAGPKDANEMTVFVVSPAEDPTFAGLNPVDRSAAEWTRPGKGESSTLQVGDVRIDLERIRARAQVLFPFVTPGLSLEHFLPGPSRDVLAHLANPLARDRPRDGASPPLAIGDARLQRVVDKAWARHERWAAFEAVAALAESHDAEAGELPRLLQLYRDQNSLQPFADADIRDPRLWAQLGIAADHVAFIAFIRRFAAAHPFTRATTELLFLLDRLAEANQDALSVLRASDPAEQLLWTRQANPDAYRLILQIRVYYDHEIGRLGLRSEEDVARYYENVRLAILEGIVRTTPHGYRASDARFLIGAIHYGQGNSRAALRVWREMTPDPGDSYFIASSQMAAALAGGREKHGEIRRILKNEHGRWLSFSEDRLHRFGYRFDTF